MYITSRRRTVRQGSLQGLYEKFLIRNLIRFSPPTQAGLYRDGPLQYYFLHGWWSGVGGGGVGIVVFKLQPVFITCYTYKKKLGKISILYYKM